MLSQRKGWRGEERWTVTQVILRWFGQLFLFVDFREGKIVSQVGTTQENGEGPEITTVMSAGNPQWYLHDY